jgi:hypothetical protein
MREVAGLEGPDGVIHAGAVDEDHARQRGVEGPAPGGGKDRLAVDSELLHASGPNTKGP